MSIKFGFYEMWESLEALGKVLENKDYKIKSLIK